MIHSDNCDEDVRRHCPACAAKNGAFEAMREALHGMLHAYGPDGLGTDRAKAHSDAAAALALADKVSQPTRRNPC